MVDIQADIKNKLFIIRTMTGDELLTPGTELSELKFDGFLDWFVSITDPRIHWKNEPTYILSQAVYLFGGLATLIHAIARGGRLLWLWIGVFIHGCFIESLSYLSPDIDNFWHSQTPIIFMGRRFPLHIMLLYSCFIYNSSVAVTKMRLSKWVEPCAVGLVVVLIDIPYDIVSVKFMHWFWHDTDPNIYDRHYWVPWNSYYFHTTFAASFTFWFHFLKEKFCKSEGKWYKGKSFLGELLTTVLAGILGPIGGIILFLPIYHPLHDGFKIHSEVTYFILFTIFLAIIWTGDRKPKIDDFTKNFKHKVHWTTLLLCLHLVLHYTLFWSISVFFNPEDEISTGIKEPIGPCNEYSSIMTVSGKVLQKRKYLCPTDYDEKYFDWSCLPNKQPPSNGAVWYTTCGTPFENRTEYIVIVSLICFLASVVFYNLNFGSFGDEIFSYKEHKITSEVKKSLKSKKKN